MEEKIIVKPIGIIHTIYKVPEGMPIQGRFDKDVTGTVEIFPEY